jgi:hypothetical protein
MGGTWSLLDFVEHHCCSLLLFDGRDGRDG